MERLFLPKIDRKMSFHTQSIDFSNDLGYICSMEIYCGQANKCMCVKFIEGGRKNDKCKINIWWFMQ